MTQTNKFEVGDVVRCIDSANYVYITTGEEYVVKDAGEDWIEIVTDKGKYFCYDSKLFEPVEEPKQTANKPHKHKDLIIAWANGAEIECYSPTDNEWYGISNPDWYEHMLYRIKPEPKPDVIKYVFVEAKPSFCNIFNDNNLKLTFCGETGKLKSAEVIS